MAYLTLRQSETRREELPDVCLACGQPATDEVRKTFSWSPPWIIFTILIAWPLTLVLMLALAKRMTVDVPVCERHRRYWLKRSLLMYAPLGSLFLLGIFGAVLASNIGQKDIAGFVCVGFGLLCFVWLVIAAIIQQMMIRPTEITDGTITLKNVDERFVDAFHRMRRGRGFDRDFDEGVEDYDERMRRRRERRARDRTGFDDDVPPPRQRRDPDAPPDDRIRREPD